MPFAMAADGTELYYRDWGTGVPVVLIHGWPLCGDMWEKQAEFLAQNGARVIVYDRRGFGRSDQPWQGYDYDTFAADLNTIMETLDLTGAVLVGFSMGGGEVVRYLAKYGSQRVVKAVLISSVTPFLLQTDDNPDGINIEDFQKIEGQILTDRPEFLKSFGLQFYGRSMIHHSVSEPVLEWTFGLALMASLHSTVAAAKAWASTDFRQDLPQIKIPVLVIHGASDETVPIDKSARKAIKLLTNATMTEYENQPHGLFMTATDRLNEELLRFIEVGTSMTKHMTASAVL
ncbi:MAG TPA: alpha/beta hydrolase [Bryobacteraceae bacterium]|jgi:pimeloyl-ACP methyl ester carboxylesterase